jgi:large subunit ribosomal protein L31
MKKQGHPLYQEVLFVDSTTGFQFVCGSTLQPKERDTFNGKEYPVYRVSISSASHPTFTGQKQFVDSAGRIERFKNRYSKETKPVSPPVEAPKKKKKSK